MYPFFMHIGLNICMKLTNLIKYKHRDKKLGKTRSPKWAKVGHDYLLKSPVCEACGSTNQLNVHHKKPFHLYPELELDTNNLITLCMDNDCHLLIGHGGNFKKYNPNIDIDVLYLKQNTHTLVESIIQIINKAKINRLPK